MYMRFRMQIESVMKEVTFRAELRARVKVTRGSLGAGGVGSWNRAWSENQEVGVVEDESHNFGSFGLKKAAGEHWQHSPTSLMWKLRP